MACRVCLERRLKLLNFLLTFVGLAMVEYGIYLLVEYQRATSNTLVALPMRGDESLVQLGRPLLMGVSQSTSIFDDLLKAWFIYLFIGIGAIFFITSCFGCIGAVTRNGCCLTCYLVLVILLILVELGCAAFIFYDKSWEAEIPTDSTGDFEMIHAFLKEHWEIFKWVALGAVVLEALLFLLALVLRAANTPPECDSGEELITPRQQIRPRLIKSPPDPTLDVPVAGTLDQHPSRNDVLNTSMREKDQKRRIDGYLDTVVQLKKVAVDIKKDVDSQNRMLDRMGNDMDSSREALSGTMDRFKMIFEANSTWRKFALVVVGSLLFIWLVIYYLSG